MGKLKQKWEPNVALDKKKGVTTTFGLRMREFSHLAKRSARACPVGRRRDLLAFVLSKVFIQAK